MTGHTPHTRRRAMEPLPSRKKHALLVACFLTVILAGGYLLTSSVGNENDATVKGTVSVAPMPLPPSFETLGGDTEALPDLLAGDVPVNVNPTEIVKPQIDALGNPVGNPTNATSSPATLPVVTNSQSAAISSGPRTITIDGAPIDGSGSALVPAPISGLTKISPYGRVPAISATGMTPLSAYKRPAPALAGKRPVSIIIGGLGR